MNSDTFCGSLKPTGLQKVRFPFTLREIRCGSWGFYTNFEVVRAARGCALDVESLVGPSVKVLRERGLFSVVLLPNVYYF